MGKWTSARGLRQRGLGLRRLRGASIRFLLAQYFHSWRRHCYLQHVRRGANCLALNNKVIIQGTYFWKFVKFAFKSRQRRYATSVLSMWRKQHARLLLSRSVATWRNFCGKVQEETFVAQLAYTSSLRRAVVARWRGALRSSRLLRSLGTLCRRAMRQTVRRIFGSWAGAAASRMQAQNMEQATLKPLAAQYLARWSAARLVLPLRRRVDRSKAMSRMRSAYERWVRWLLRLVKVYQVEQQRHVVLLQRYFLQWRVLHSAGFLRDRNPMHHLPSS